MIVSMTGYGKYVCELENLSASQADKKAVIELKSLNSKQLDLSLRMPGIYREKESEIRSVISKQLDRGKVDFSIFIEQAAAETAVRIDQSLAKAYHRELRSLAGKLGESTTGLMPLVLKMPDVIKHERQEPDEKEWRQIKQGVDKAIEAIKKFREDEGRKLAKDIEGRIKLIADLLKKVEAQDKKRIPALRKRIQKNITEFVKKEKIDQNRFEQELIYYIEKIDITEEKVRLKTHCDYFLKTMKELLGGRKLGFISQEIGREINTIGSKANDANIQKLVVQMKDEMEKVKEQLLNVL